MQETIALGVPFCAGSSTKHENNIVESHCGLVSLSFSFWGF